jgi:TolA-binding protein
MRIPILYPACRSLAAPALYQAGQVLQNAQREAEATIVWRELVRDYPKSHWADLTAGKLNE